MTLEEAIKTLQTEADLAQRQPETGIYDALKLGIEALKRIPYYRKLSFPISIDLLPGETND